MSKSSIKLNFTSVNANNLGNGIGVFNNINPSNTLNLKSLSGGTNVSLTENNGTITISSAGGSTAGATTLVELNDTTINTPTNGEVIRYSSGSTTWENVDLYTNLTDKVLPRYDEATKSLCNSSIRNRNSSYITKGYNTYSTKISNANGFSLSGNSGYVNNFRIPIPISSYGSLSPTSFNAGLTKSCISIFMMNTYSNQMLNYSCFGDSVIHDVEWNFRWTQSPYGGYCTYSLSVPKITTHGSNDSTISVGNGISYGNIPQIYVNTQGGLKSEYTICSTISQKTIIDYTLIGGNNI